jgi:glycosyltransferase involved in cell wall biosynthesis
MFFRHIAVKLRELRPSVVCAVNEELAFAVLPFKGRYYRALVCDIFDSLGARAGTRAWYKRGVLRAVSYLGLAGADRLIATDEHRRDMLGSFSGKAIVVENVPEDPGPALAQQIPSGPIRIWAAGSIEREKGFPELLQAVEQLPDVQIVSAGWPYDDFASEVFLKHPRVEFHGIVTARRSLELAASCDAVFCFYAPLHAYRANASPNKVYDAMAVGRPVFINREVRLATWVEDTGVGDVCAYADVAGLRHLIAELMERRATLPAFAARSRGLFLERYQWALMETRLASLYREVRHAT